MDPDLVKLAELISTRNEIVTRISSITNRPASIGHTGEYIASKIFDIQLEESASHKASDRTFQSGSLAGNSVNIKWYGKHDSLLDITPEAFPDYYLVITGEESPPASSRGAIRPWIISRVFLFDAKALISRLRPFLHIFR